LIDDFDVFYERGDILYCIKPRDDIELGGTKMSWNSSNVQLLVELCDPEEFDGCDPDIEKSKQYAEVIKIYTQSYSQQVDFGKREGDPIFWDYTAGATKKLKFGDPIKEKWNLQPSEVKAFDNRFSSFFQSIDFKFCRLEGIFNEDLYEGNPNALLYSTISLSTTKQQHRRSAFNILSVCGEIGGLFKILTFVASLLLAKWP
jgi:hypothetical protein